MNQQDIHREVDRLIMQAEKDIEQVFARRLKEILAQIERMYRKYGKNGDPSYTDLTKYNRLQKELQRISEMLNEDYRAIVKQIAAARQTIYVENYLMHAYLFEMAASTEMGFALPSTKAIEEVLLNPIKFLTLPFVMEQHRNDIIRRINIEISQSLLAGEGYWKMAKRIENTVGFSRKKAILVARTEGGRSQSISGEKVAEQAAKYVRMGKVWVSALDLRVRAAHRKLDGQKADSKGLFHYQGLTAPAPNMWGKADMDINCRCVVMRTINGMLPEYRRGRNYMDADYQRKLFARVDELMADEDMTYLQAIKKAQKQIQPPSVAIPYVTFDSWKEKYAG